MYGVERRREGFGGKTREKEVTWKAQEQMERIIKTGIQEVEWGHKLD
jgi:hypothetical protein